MSAISTQLSHSGYYQLNSSGAGSGNTSGASGAASTSALRNAGVNAVSSASGFSDAVLLDLSPAAKQYLSGLSAQAATTQGNGNTSTDFVLSAQQKEALSSILDKYKDAPYTQDTFDQIQNDLQKAGIGPDQLSAKERVSSFSATAVLVDALNGGNGSTPGSTPVSDADLKTKSANYMQDVIAQWKKISADYQAKQSADAVAPVGSADGAS